ncbi:calponin homology domain-containing protein DDB_G0272472-like [Neodiprion lecontei]|uniref:Calponin homology domain-containing protein DDB_G0272472-like n=1 Tax=Neodiprion lecontei TaxID=441921 RepID=A0ABM3FQB3_NEOLC|nr:calponin homology domain-containing protein DDB_G0272472-like [Neodiprion lecontei]
MPITRSKDNETGKPTPLTETELLAYTEQVNKEKRLLDLDREKIASTLQQFKATEAAYNDQINALQNRLRKAEEVVELRSADLAKKQEEQMRKRENELQEKLEREFLVKQLEIQKHLDKEREERVQAQRQLEEARSNQKSLDKQTESEIRIETVSEKTEQTVINTNKTLSQTPESREETTNMQIDVNDSSHCSNPIQDLETVEDPQILLEKCEKEFLREQAEIQKQIEELEDRKLKRKTMNPQMLLLAERKKEYQRKKTEMQKLLEDLQKEEEREIAKLEVKSIKPKESVPNSDVSIKEELANLKEILKTVNTGAMEHPQNYIEPITAEQSIPMGAILAGVPSFDGENVAFSLFVRACRRAKGVIAPRLEKQLVRNIKAKLKDKAYIVVEDQTFDTLESFLDKLSSVFTPSRSVNFYRGELARIFKGPSEHIIEYIGRIKDLKTSILECERRANGSIDEETEKSIESETLKGFIEGLPTEFSTGLYLKGYTSLPEAFDGAIDLGKRFDMEKNKRKRATN